MFQIISAIISLGKLVSTLKQIFRGIVLLFRKDPVEEMRKAEEAHRESKNKERTQDDTTNTFGG